MPHIDAKKKQINCKIVYYGTGLGGKTTNLNWICWVTNVKDFQASVRNVSNISTH